MQHIIRQLEQVRTLSRALLLTQRLAQALAVALAAALACGLLDYALRLPGWLRLVIAVTLVVAGAAWLGRRLIRIAVARLDLDVLALRAERLYPNLAGTLASGVEFAAQPEHYHETPRQAALAQATVRDAQTRLGGASLRRLVNPAKALRYVGLALVMVLVFGGVVALAPGAAAMATQRWLMPLSDQYQWPRRTQIVSLVTEEVWPSDTPLRLRARVERGYASGMRTWAWYRATDRAGAAGPWRQMLMNEQAAADEGRRGVFESILDSLAMTGAETSAATAATPAAAAVEFYFAAGDHQTEPQTVRFVDRPALRALRVRIEPPAYAQGLVNPQEVDLLRAPASDQQYVGSAGRSEQRAEAASASGLIGSTVRLELEFNKPVSSVRMLGAEFDASAISPADRPRLALSLTLDETLESPVHLVDEHGLTNLSDRLYRIEAVADAPPAVSITAPPTDESVLPTAVVALEAVAQDDVGVERVALEAQPRTAPAQGEAPEPPQHVELQQEAGRSIRLGAAHQLELSAFELKPGDELLVTALAHDVFNLDGLRHDPVRSTPRRLRIIDQAALVAQVRDALAVVRQTAIRLESRQRELLDPPAELAQPGQQELSNRLDTQAEFVQSLSERLERNRVDEPQVAGLLERTAELLERGERASRGAEGKLDEARREARDQAEAERQREGAREDQRAVSEALSELISALDQGRDTMTPAIQVGEILRAQQELARETSEAMSGTLGKTPEELTPQERGEVGELARRQGDLERRAEGVVAQMREAAARLEREARTPQEQAAARALEEAARIAERQGLTEQMRRAAEAAQENQGSEAGEAQEQSIATMQAMMNELGSASRRQNEVLRRKLMALEESIRKLIERQKGQLDQLDRAQSLAALAPAMSTLWRNTLAVQQEAAAAKETAAAAHLLGEAAAHQSGAIGGLREEDTAAAREGETRALASLESALKEVERLREEVEREQRNQQREELRKEYRKLIAQQEALRADTEPMAALAQPTREQQFTMRELGHRQTDLRADARELGEKVRETLLFAHLHNRIDAAAERVAQGLYRGRADAAVLMGQDEVLTLLRTMADALEQAQREEPFASPEAGESGGGEGGGGGGQSPLVPPAAELKLLRGLQEVVLKRTRALSERGEPTAEVRRELLDLSVQQRELAGLGERFIQSMAPGEAMQRLEESLPEETENE